jgi:hypothetical protein
VRAFLRLYRRFCTEFILRKQFYCRTIAQLESAIGYMRDRQEKQAYLDLVNMHIARLVEQSADLTDQADTLKARKQETGHLNELFMATLSALISLRSVRVRLALELYIPDD